MRNGIKVKAPATVSNLNCGFDVLGVSLNVDNDEIVGRVRQEPGVRIELVGTNAKKTPADPLRNTAGVAVTRMLQYLGLTQSVGLELEIRKVIRPGSGLGSSASSACAAVVLANELLGKPFDKRSLLPFALMGEQVAGGTFHADNVAPCLLGGLILVRDLISLDVHKLAHPPGLTFGIVFPQTEVLTSEARASLSRSVPLHDMVRQTANLGSFVHGMLRGDLELIARSMHDAVIEKQRAHLVPAFYEMKEAALTTGALSFGLSGSGPSVFVLCPNSNVAEDSIGVMQSTLRQRGIESESFISGINEEGTMLC